IVAAVVVDGQQNVSAGRQRWQRGTHLHGGTAQRVHRGQVDARDQRVVFLADLEAPGRLYMPIALVAVGHQHARGIGGRCGARDDDIRNFSARRTGHGERIH
ncbi:MAG: hypothetical protein ACK559_09400, partial [bacterium]